MSTLLHCTQGTVRSLKGKTQGTLCTSAMNMACLAFVCIATTLTSNQQLQEMENSLSRQYERDINAMQIIQSLTACLKLQKGAVECQSFQCMYQQGLLALYKQKRQGNYCMIKFNGIKGALT